MGRITQPENFQGVSESRIRQTNLNLKSGLEENSKIQFIQTGDLVPDGAASLAAWVTSSGIGFFTVVTLPRNQDATAFFQALCMPSWAKGFVGITLGIAIDTVPDIGDTIVINLVGSAMTDVALEDIARADPVAMAAEPRRVIGEWVPLWNYEFIVNLLDSGYEDPFEIYLSEWIMSSLPINHYSSIIQVGVQRAAQGQTEDNYSGVVGVSCAAIGHFPEYE